LFFLLLIFVFDSVAQSVVIRGRVVDAESFESLAFVSIQVNEGPEGCISDIDGKFIIRSAFPVQFITLSYMGYEPVKFAVADNKDILIRMQRTAYELSETIIKPGINPAHRIIKEAFANRFINDHEHLPSFRYTSYEKMIFGPESDSIPTIDSISADSSYIRAKEFFDKQHLFIMENIVKRSFLFPEDNYNKVIASRLQMAEGTVKTHLHGIYQILRVNSRAQAILKSRQFQIINGMSLQGVPAIGSQKLN